MNAVIIVSAKESKRTIILRYMQILPLPSELADLTKKYKETRQISLRRGITGFKVAMEQQSKCTVE